LQAACRWHGDNLWRRLMPLQSPTAAPELNDPQAEAALHVQGPLLVFAGAGSGKTRVITFRVANLVSRAKVPPYRILAVTFTNKAASEMRARLGKLCGEDVARDLWVGTFHATCAKLLRSYGAAIGLERNFVIYDTDDQKQVVVRALREMDLDEKRYPPRMVLARIHREKQECRGAGDMKVDSYVDEAIVKLFGRYEEQLKSANAVDFEDLIGKVVRILEENPQGTGDALRRKFNYVLVDEFQDTNHAQYRFLRALTQGHKNLCVVGDDDQSIYRWRGADVRNIRGFKEDFPDALVVKLEQNYRSSARIVAAALGVIAPSRERVPKDLWTANEPGRKVELVATSNERDEAAHVVRVIQESQREGIDLKQVAVFYRIHAQSRVLEEALRAVNLPYQIIGGTKFYERAEIKDAIAYLRVLLNPRSDVDLRRIINTPARGIGDTTIDRLASFAGASGITMHEALSRLDEAPEIARTARGRLEAVRELLAALRTEASVVSPSELLIAVLDRTGYRESLEADDGPESEARLENLEELVGSLGDYEAEAAAAGEPPSLEGYLERVTLQADVDQMKDASRVTLMTVHGAKGLEFEVVLLTGMEEEMFPYRGMEPGGEQEMEEERRLAYVAITRARARLVMTHTDTRQIFGTTRWGRPSRFLADLPSDSIEHLATRARGTAPERFIDRDRHADEWSRRVPRGEAMGGVQHPQRPAAREPERAPGERFVDREFFSDAHQGTEEAAPLRRGSRVMHERFGEGEVRRVENAAEPAVVAFFPGWGEKKILARFLKVP
jgi:DNA helicase-2/ATP-dependent DNA helicase PcrA